MDSARTDLTAEDIGVRLRAVRDLTGLTVAQLAKASGVPRRDINSAEQGRRVLDASALRAVAGALGVAPAVLVSSGQTAAHEPRDAHRTPAGPAPRTTGAPVPVAYDLPSAERRIDDEGRVGLESSWVAVRGEMHAVIDAATRLAMVGSTDDPSVLMRNVAMEIDKLGRNRGFQAAVARHQAELLEARTGQQRHRPPV